ncbi:MAG: NADH oxidoreductase Hcr [Cocleimonas sp.]
MSLLFVINFIRKLLLSIGATMPSSSKPSSTLLPPTLKPLKLNSSGLGQSTNNAKKAAPVSSKLQAPTLSFSLGGDSDNSAKAISSSKPSSKLNTKLQKPKLSFSLGEPAAKVAVKPAAWSPANTPLVLVQREYETHDSVSFTFAAADNQLFDFKPGQFVTLAVKIDDETHYRAYSISSVPQQKQLRLTIKRVPDGLVSNWLVDNLNVGDSLSALNIAGQFNSTDCTHKSKLLFISAGCGITPVMSMAKTLLAANNMLAANTDNTDLNIEFLHCARDKDNVIFHDEMTEMAAQHSQFNVQLLLENSAGFSAQSELAHQTGMVSAEAVQTLYPDLDQRTIFLCGPVGFMKAVQTIAEQSGFDMANFFQESFTPAADNTQQDGLSAAEADLETNVMLHVPDFSVAAEVKQGTLLLDALEQNNVPVIGACRAGVCGSCKCKVTSGTVTSTSTETLTAAEIEQGFVLACSSTVQGDVAVALS